MSKHSFVALVALAAAATTTSPLLGAGLAAQRVEVYQTPQSGTVVQTPQSGTVLRTPAMAGGMQTSRRAVIGVHVDLRPGPNDSVGATLVAVTPGGPAARAGLVAGDIVTKFNGTALAERGRRSADHDNEEEQSAPGLRMLELAARMAPGDTVAVEWKHERQRKTARIVTEPSTAMVFSGQPDFRVFTDEGPGGAYRYRVELGDQGPAELRQRLGGRLESLRPLAMLPGFDGDHVFMRIGGPFGGIQFAPLNADLGRYFGTTEGILVLETPDTSAHIDLKGGDVILSIGDRKPTSVEHLFRILGSYQDDENVRFDVMRDKRRVTVEAKADDLRASGRMRTFERTIPDRAPEPVRPAQPRRSPRPGT